jgi:hypothetical protein
MEEPVNGKNAHRTNNDILSLMFSLLHHLPCTNTSDIKHSPIPHPSVHEGKGKGVSSKREEVATIPCIDTNTDTTRKCTSRKRAEAETHV